MPESYNDLERKLREATATEKRLRDEIQRLKAQSEDRAALKVSTFATAYGAEAQGSYDPQREVAKMMRAFGQEVRPTPTMPSDPKERILRARIVLEEAMEFVAALGCEVLLGEKPLDDINTMTEGAPWQKFIVLKDDVKIECTGEGDLVEAADALADLKVVVYGSDNALGLNANEVFREVMRSNMTKVLPDGSVLRDEGGKVVKPKDYDPPNIRQVLGL